MAESRTSQFVPNQKRMSDRVNITITTTFITSFILWNWKFFLYLIFSKDEIGKRIEDVTELYIDFWSFLVPILIVISYLFIIPLISIIYSIVRRKFEERFKIKS